MLLLRAEICTTFEPKVVQISITSILAITLPIIYFLDNEQTFFIVRKIIGEVCSMNPIPTQLIKCIIFFETQIQQIIEYHPTNIYVMTLETVPVIF